ncbi:MAG: hypothetical protein HY321_20255 [Armatimonadetes bacterium]|nr:hypothetical protein [Armatimonadota bacterium]
MDELLRQWEHYEKSEPARVIAEYSRFFREHQPRSPEDSIRLSLRLVGLYYDGQKDAQTAVQLCDWALTRYPGRASLAGVVRGCPPSGGGPRAPVPRKESSVFHPNDAPEAEERLPGPAVTVSADRSRRGSAQRPAGWTDAPEPRVLAGTAHPCGSPSGTPGLAQGSLTAG